MDRHSRTCRPCHWSAKRRPKATNICGACGRDAPPDAKGRERKFCSVFCVGMSVGKNGAARIRRPPTVKTCALCEKEWSTYHRNQRFCSRECSKLGSGYIFHSGRDGNHDAITAALESRGVAVQDASNMGSGFPDLLTAYLGVVRLIEIKNPATAHGKRGLTPAQKRFASMWPVTVVRDEREALAAHGL